MSAATPAAAWQDALDDSDSKADCYKGADDGAQILPLRAFELPSAPFHRRAIAFSDDAELAVAADDSVHLLPPQFPHTESSSKEVDEETGRAGSRREATIAHDTSDDSRSPNEQTETETDSDGEHSQGDDDSDPLGEEAPIGGGAPDTRRQYAQGARHVPVSFPLHIEVNRHLYDNAGLYYPYDSVVAQEEDEGGEPRIFHHPAGSGTGTINATASSMNSVVDIQWSPRGLGRNGRCVLGVLTSGGVLTIYGESSSRLAGVMTTYYDYSGWKVMWAVGERFIVPPQKAYGEHVYSFAWAPELMADVAVVATKTDQDEIVIIPAQRVTVPEDGKGIKERAEWHVREAARFHAPGPHPKGSFMDPGFVPTGTGYGLRWGPWLVVGSKKTSVMAYISRNYVGFRRISVDELVPMDRLPSIEVEAEDLGGFCTFLSTDSFVEWEGTVRSHGVIRLLYRG